MSDREIIAVMFSCGAASAVAAKMTVERFSKTHDIRIVNNPIKEEDEDNRRFLEDISSWIGMPIEIASHPRYPSNSASVVWNDVGYMSGVQGASCTRLLKKEARYIWERENPYHHLVMGFTVDELSRHRRFVLTERSNVIPVLIDAGITKEMCFQIISNAGISLPRSYLKGYPNADCLGCVKASSPTYWNHVRVSDPEIYQSRAEQSRRIGAKLVRYQGKRIFLDELPVDAKGRRMKSIKMPECGIFCEEKP